MGKSATPQMQVTEYRMSVHLGVAYTLDKITELRVNEKVAWQGNSSTLESIYINQPELFGGQKKEGGLVGYMTHLPGAVDQVLPENIASRFGRTSATCPAFRGITTLFFSGGGAVVRGSATVTGVPGEPTIPLEEQDAGRTGFSWSFNNPAIAQTVWVKGTRAPKTALDPAYAMIGQHANPAHLIAECMTNTEWGMGSPASSLNLATTIGGFNYAAQMLFNEGFGLSMKWMRSSKIEDFIGEVLDHIQAVLYLNPRTGLWDLKLLRDDYDPATLRTLDASNSKLRNFARRLWGEAGNQVVVTFTNPENEEDVTITAEDLAAINSQGGSPVPIARSYYGIRDPNLALRVAKRDVRAASAPLASATVEVDRTAWDLLPGDVVHANWPNKQINNVVMRVMDVPTRGKPGSGKIRVNLLEDIFSLEHAPDSPPQGTGWTDPGEAPTPMDAVELITLPAYLTLSADVQTAAVDLEYPEVLAAVLAYASGADVRSYGLFAQVTDPNGASVYVDHGARSVVERLTLADPWPWATSARIADSAVLNKVRGPSVGGFAFIGTGGDAGMEIAQVSDYDTTTNEWVLTRGVLDTVPQAWPAGTPVWFVNKGYRIVDEKVLHADGETVEFKLCPRTSKGVLSLADTPVVSATLTARPHLPLRPANVKVNGFVNGPWGIDPEVFDTLSITWATRNRTLEDGQVVAWDAGPVAPEYEQATIVTVKDQTGAVVYQQKLWTENALDLPRAWFDRYTALTIEVSSRRRDLDSLQKHSFQVTGLPGDVNAPPPPAAPDPGPAPSPDAAPSADAWTVTGSQFTLDSEGKTVGSIPAILISGERDRENAIGLIVRYRKIVPGQAEADYDWIYLSEVALNDDPKQTGTTAVAPETDYGVAIAYRSASNILSEWRDMGTVTTGQIVAQMLQDLTADAIRGLVQQTDDTVGEVQADVADLQTRANALESDTSKHATSILQLVMRAIDVRKYVDPHLFVGQQSVSKVVAQEITDRQDGDAAVMEIMDLVGLVTADKSAIIVNDTTFRLSETESVVYRLNVIQSNIDGVSAAITTEQQTRASADEAFVQTIALLGAANAGKTAFVMDTSTVQIGGGVPWASKLASLSAADSSNAADITSEQSARISGDNANATSISNLTTTVNGNTASISTLQSSVNGVLAKYGVLLNVNGHITGFLQNNNGLTGDFSILADKFAIIDPSSPGTKIVPFSVIGGYANFANPVTVYKVSTGYKLVIGPGFGVSGDLVLWYGPSATAISSCTKANGVMAITTAGDTKIPGTTPKFTVSASGGANWSGVASGATQTTNTVTITPTGGDGSEGFSYSWSFNRGTVFDIKAPSSATTAFEHTVSSGENLSGTYTCWVTDIATGAVAYVNVLARFTATN